MEAGNWKCQKIISMIDVSCKYFKSHSNFFILSFKFFFIFSIDQAITNSKSNY